MKTNFKIVVCNNGDDIKINNVKINTNHGTINMEVWETNNDIHFINSHGLIIFIDHNDPQTIDKAMNILGLYRRLSDSPILLCGINTDSDKITQKDVARLIRVFNLNYIVGDKDKALMWLTRKLTGHPDLVQDDSRCNLM